MRNIFLRQNKFPMSVHNHDEEFIRQTIQRPAQKVGKKLQKKADDLKDKMVVTALLNADIKGLSADEAKAKLNNIIDEILGE